jgi:hypothetical protein
MLYCNCIVTHYKQLKNMQFKPRLAKCTIATENIDLETRTCKICHSNQKMFRWIR